MRCLFTNKIHQIAEQLFKKIEDQRIGSKLGLFDGRFGILLFLAHYMRQFNNQTHQSTYDMFCENCFDELISNEITHSYCSGLSGIFSCLKFANINDFLKVDYSDVQNAYEEILYNSMVYEFHLGHYDVLHGALGTALYFANDAHFAGVAVKWLEENAVQKADIMKWPSIIDEESKKKGYNICLSHGISSIIYVLCKIYNEGLLTNRVEALIKGAVSYILSQELNPLEFGNFFPSQSTDNDCKIYTSRLAWCYGDLGIAISLWFAGKTLNNISWQNKANEVMLFNSSRREIMRSGVKDAGLCHGSAGIAMMFQYMHEQTEDNIFADTSKHWMKVTLDFAKFTDGLAGYKTYDPREKNGWRDEICLLDGIAGTGLMLLTAVDANTSTASWTNLFMLS